MNARLYPVSGPTPAQTQLPVLKATVSGLYNVGSISIRMPDGKVCKGTWNRVVAPATASVPPTPGLAPVWDSVYGSGYYVAHVLGRRLHAAASVTGEQGTVYQVEFYQTDDVHDFHLFGVAKDSTGVIYKMVFGV